MPLATDMGATPEVGGIARYNPATGCFPTLQGLSAINLGPLSKPEAGVFTSLLSSVTVSDRIDRMVVSIPTSATALGGAVLPLIATPYTIDLACLLCAVPATNSTAGLGLLLYDGTKLWSFWCGMSSQFRNALIIKWTNTTTQSTTAINAGTPVTMGLHFLRVTDDGASRSGFVSNNGKDYAQVFSEATNAFLTPTQFGISTFNNSLGGALAAKGSVYHLKISPGILGDSP